MRVKTLPTFNGYTVDTKLSEFRRAIPDVALEFISFDSAKSKEMLEELKSFDQEKILPVGG